MAIRRIPKDTIWKIETVIINGVRHEYVVPDFKAMRNKYRKKDLTFHDS